MKSIKPNYFDHKARKCFIENKPGIAMQWNEGNVLFNDTLNTFYLHMVKYHSDSKRKPAAATWATLSD